VALRHQSLNPLEREMAAEGSLRIPSHP
jgi:hypothetical protein